MISDFSPDDVSSPEEFEAALGQVLRAAMESDVDPRGSWVYRDDGTGANVEVQIVELAD